MFVCVCVCKDKFLKLPRIFAKNKINFREKDDISRMFVCVCKDEFRENKINFAKKTIFRECLCVRVCKNKFRALPRIFAKIK